VQRAETYAAECRNSRSIAAPSTLMDCDGPLAQIIDFHHFEKPTPRHSHRI
jgi:hypothetical protein